ncbi:MAG: hypothetical protein EZS28_014554 [Streblomastix strix]|uniref:Uncharacterized protein n=1 Tax=Streblomastix strix TaxID=222440 RepID=A0A5J4W5I6_9EUKA|nr:MAG: hypothetical protein EZS28_014554 [Streblomastix strix]
MKEKENLKCVCGDDGLLQKQDLQEIESVNNCLNCGANIKMNLSMKMKDAMKSRKNQSKKNVNETKMNEIQMIKNQNCYLITNYMTNVIMKIIDFLIKKQKIISMSAYLRFVIMLQITIKFNQFSIFDQYYLNAQCVIKEIALKDLHQSSSNEDDYDNDSYFDKELSYVGDQGEKNFLLIDDIFNY